VRVLIDTSYALRGPSGTATYLRELTRALPAAGVEVLAAQDTGRAAPGGGPVRSARNALHDARWARTLARGRDVDVVHHPLPAHTPGVPNVVTVHDLAFVRRPQDFARTFRLWATRAHRRAVDRAGAVVVPSATTRDDLVELWDVEPARIVVAPHGADHQHPVDARPELLLYVGDQEPRKRVGLLRAEHARYRAAGGTLPLRILGRGGEAGDPAQALRTAAALVTASAYEGFGLPLAEAMRAGVPVIALDAPGVREVAPHAVVTDLAAAMHRAQDPSWRAAQRALGRERAKPLTWSRSAACHREAYALARTR
jgi:glycosyltransferase involved in cell wall biosynthesis